MQIQYRTLSAMLFALVSASLPLQAAQAPAPTTPLATVAAAETAADPAADPAAAKVKFRLRLLDASMKAAEGNLAMMQGDEAKGATLMQEAITIYDAALAVAPEDVTALNGRGMARNLLVENSGREDLRKSIAISTATLAKDAKDAHAYHARAVAYRALDEYDAARKDYQAAIALKPDRSNWPLDLRAMEAEAKLQQLRK